MGKEAKAKKTKDEQIKAELNLPLEEQHQVSEPESHQIKSETLFKTEPQPPHSDNQYNPPELPPISMAETQMYFSNRLLTPCSDTEMFVHAHHSLSTSPASEYHHEQPFNYSATAPRCTGNESNNWHPSPSPFSHSQC